MAEIGRKKSAKSATARVRNKGDKQVDKSKWRTLGQYLEEKLGRQPSRSEIISFGGLLKYNMPKPLYKSRGRYGTSTRPSYGPQHEEWMDEQFGAWEAKSRAKWGKKRVREKPKTWAAEVAEELTKKGFRRAQAIAGFCRSIGCKAWAKDGNADDMSITREGSEDPFMYVKKVNGKFVATAKEDT